MKKSNDGRFLGFPYHCSHVYSITALGGLLGLLALDAQRPTLLYQIGDFDLYGRLARKQIDIFPG